MFGAVLEYVIVRLHSEKNLKERNKERADRDDIEMMSLKQVSVVVRFLRWKYLVHFSSNPKTLCSKHESMLWGVL